MKMVCIALIVLGLAGCSQKQTEEVQRANDLITDIDDRLNFVEEVLSEAPLGVRRSEWCRERNTLLLMRRASNRPGVKWAYERQSTPESRTAAEVCY